MIMKLYFFTIKQTALFLFFYVIDLICRLKIFETSTGGKQCFRKTKFGYHVIGLAILHLNPLITT